MLSELAGCCVAVWWGGECSEGGLVSEEVCVPGGGCFLGCEWFEVECGVWTGCPLSVEGALWGIRRMGWWSLCSVWYVVGKVEVVSEDVLVFLVEVVYWGVGV